jgi:Stage II sporulation protein M
MAAPELATTLVAASQRTPRLSAPACSAFAGLWIATALGAGAELLDPGLTGATPPHPTLHATPAAIASVFTTNLRVLALPFLLIAVGCHINRITRLAGDMSVAAVLAINAFRIGVAIGRWRTVLVPYLPHLPLEYAAVAVAASAWIKFRQHGISHPSLSTREAIVELVAATALLLAAAAVEVLLTPHAR